MVDDQGLRCLQARVAVYIPDQASRLDFGMVTRYGVLKHHSTGILVKKSAAVLFKLVRMNNPSSIYRLRILVLPE